MRKLLLTVVALVLMSASCFAANWEWIYSSAQKGFFFDKDSVTFDLSKDKKIVNRDKLYAWVKIVYDKEFSKQTFQRDDVEYCIDHFGFDLQNNEVCEKHVLFYDKNKNVLHEEKNVLSWQKAVPDSVGDRLLEYFAKYARAHEEEIEQRTRGAR